jgi:hypothetical protein
MRTAKRLLALMALVAGLVLSLTGPAAATSAVCDRSCAGRASFNSVTHDLTGSDHRADGHSVVVWNKRYDLGQQWFAGWVTGGNGSSQTWHLSMPPGTRIDYEVCLGEFGSRTTLWDTCGSMVTDWAY